MNAVAKDGAAALNATSRNGRKAIVKLLLIKELRWKLQAKIDGPHMFAAMNALRMAMSVTKYD